jgi:hypothetical protein
MGSVRVWAANLKDGSGTRQTRSPHVSSCRVRAPLQVLQMLAEGLGKPAAELAIYDPYCPGPSGAVKRP